MQYQCYINVIISEQYSISYHPLYGSEKYHASVFPINYGFDL